MLGEWRWHRYPAGWNRSDLGADATPVAQTRPESAKADSPVGAGIPLSEWPRTAQAGGRQRLTGEPGQIGAVLGRSGYGSPEPRTMLISSIQVTVLSAATMAGFGIGARPIGDQPLADFQARCVFADGSARLDSEELEGLFDRLQVHADGHGWQWEWDGPDFVLPESAVRCPEEVVDAIAKLAEEPDTGRLHQFVLRLAAHTLHRNGRAEAGIRMLVEARDDARTKGDNRKTQSRVSALAEHATRLAARAGRWEDVLEIAPGWTSEAGCGVCSAEATCSQRLLVARSLVALGRAEDAIEVVRGTVSSEWTRDARLFEVWIDCELALERARNAEEAARAIRESVPDSDWWVDRALQSWTVVHASREMQLASLEILAWEHRELAVPLLLSLDAEQVSALLPALEVEGQDFRQPALAGCLADIGFPCVGEKLAAVRASRSGREMGAYFGFVERKWQAGNKRWDLLMRR
jgi:hypothetical protein